MKKDIENIKKISLIRVVKKNMSIKEVIDSMTSNRIE